VNTVILRAPLLTISGYGTHSRQIYRWLRSRNIPVKTQIVPWGVTPWYVNPDSLDGMVGDIMSRSTSLDVRAERSIQVQLPNEWDTTVAAKNIGVSAFVETDRCNPSWESDCNKMDAIVAPSTFTKKIVTNSVNVNVPFYVIPESYHESPPNTDFVDCLDFSTDFNFLVFGQITGNNPENDRKNLFYTIKWLCETFSNDKNVGIVVKTNSGRNTSIDRLQTSRLIKQLVKEVRKGPFPKIHLLHGALSESEIMGLYGHPKVKALVSLTRGEGFGLPLLEAAASGLPVIATNWSGHLDFLNEGRFSAVEYDLIDIHPSRIDNSIFIPGAKWAMPREKEAKRRLKKFRTSSQLPKQWATDLAGKLRNKFSQESINLIYDECLMGFIE